MQIKNVLTVINILGVTCIFTVCLTDVKNYHGINNNKKKLANTTE